MRSIFLFVLLFLSTLAVAQSPALINYQGAARDAAGAAMANTTLSIRFEFLQGASLPTTVFTETQSIVTNSLGLFTTQIGKNTSGGLSAVNFDAGKLQLRVGMDVSGGSSFVTLGTQSLVTVPYSMYASSVPATYTNNVLTIGNTSFTLSNTGAVYSAGNGISIISNTITNTAPDQTVSIDPGNSNVSVTGTYPNFSVSTTPSLSLLAPGTLSISNGNTVNIDPALSFNNGTLTVGSSANTIAITPSIGLTGNVLNVGPLNNSITIPTGTFLTTNITPSGAVTSTNSGSSFTLNVPPSNIVLSNLPGAAGVVTLSTNSFSINVPSPSLSLLPANTISLTNGGTVVISPSLGLTGNTLNVGPTSNTILIPGATIQSLTLLSPNSVSITNGGSVAIAPSLVVNNNTLTVGPNSNSIALITPNIVGGGAVTVGTTSANNYSVSVPATNFTVTNLAGAVSMNTLSTNSFSLNIPSQTNQSLSLLPANTISLTNGGTVVISPSLGLTGNTLNVGPTSNTILIPGATIQSLTLLSPNSVSITNGGSVAIAPSLVVNNNTLTVGPNSNSIALITPNIVGGGAVTVGTTSANNYSVSVPVTNFTVTNLAGAVSMNTLSANSFSLNIPSQTNQSLSLLSANTISLTNGGTVAIAPSLSVNNNTLTVGPNSNSIALITPNIVGGGAVTVGTTSANSYSVSVPTTQLSQGSNVNISGSYPTFTIAATPSLALVGSSISISNGNAVPLPFASLTGSGVAAVTGSPNFTINVPATNIVISNTSAAAGITTVSANNFNINVPSPNITVTNLAGAASVNTVSLNNYSINVPPTTVSAAGLASVVSSGNSYTLGVPIWTYDNSTGSIVSGASTLNILPSLSISGGTIYSGVLSNSVPITGLLNSGTINYVPKWNSATSLASTSQLFDNGTNVGIGTSAPAQKLDITGSLRIGAGAGVANDAWLFSTPSAGQAFITAGARAFTEARIVQSANAPLTFHTNNAESMRIDGLGNVAIGSATAGLNPGSNRYLTVSSGSVYTGAPSAIEIVGASTAIATPVGKLDFLSVGPTGTFNNIGRISSHRTGGTNTGYLALYTNAGAGITERMRIEDSGEVGIGLTNPTEALEVNGNVEIPVTSDYKYASTKTKYATISAAEFSPIGGFSVNGNGTGNARYISSGTPLQTASMYGGIQLPSTGTITAIDVYVWDNDALVNVNAEFVGFNMAGNVINTIATTGFTSGIPTIDILTVTGLNTTINNTSFSYFIKFNTYQANSNLWIRGARITYIVDKAE